MGHRRDGLAGARKALGHTQGSLARALEVERSTVVRWEAGSARPQPWQRPRLARLLGISQAELGVLLDQPDRGADTRTRRRGGNLPAEVTSFVDRRHEVGEAKRLLATTRMLTLIGFGGVGKTRLALRVAQEVRRAFPDGVWLVELAALDNAGLLAETVIAALGSRHLTRRAPLDALADYLEDKHLLLILDNCEHLGDACAGLASKLLGSAPDLRILATSRHTLEVEGEQILPVPPLDAPDPADLPEAGDLDQYGAIRLFTERAKAGDPSFALTAENRLTVARICHGLDGIALAVELAAARVRVLSVEQILHRLDDSLQLLTSGNSSTPRRHRTLRAAIDWSYDLCSPAEGLLWTRASVFVGGFELDTAEMICQGEAVAPENVFELVAALVDKSILVRSGHGPHARYEMLETIRRYGQDRLRRIDREIAVRRRHLDHYLRLSERFEAEWFGPDQVAWLRRLRAEHANLRLALEFCLAQPDQARAGMRMAAALRYYWSAGGCHSEGRHWLTSALALETDPSGERMKALVAAGVLTALQNDPPGSAALVAEYQDLLGHLDEESTLRPHGDEFLGTVALYSGDLSRSVALLEQALARARLLDDAHMTGRILTLLAGVCLFQGDIDRTAVFGEQARTICQAHGEQWNLSWALLDLAEAAWSRGELGQTMAHARSSLEIKYRLDEPLGLAMGLEVLARPLVATGRYERATELLGAAQAIWASLSVSARLGFPQLNQPYQECVTRARAAMGKASFEAALARGAGRPLREAVADALDDQVEPSPPAPHQPKGGPVAPLTRREWEVAELVAQGLPNKDIAASLVIAQRTVEGHVERILRKLGFTSRVQIVVWVVEKRG